MVTSTQTHPPGYLHVALARRRTARGGMNRERMAPWVVAIVACGLAIFLAAQFSELSRHLWQKLEQDRSTHYELGLNLALDIRHGDLAALRHHLDGARVWGPLHGILVAVVELALGPDYRLGIMPSLLAWAASAVLAYLVTRRLIPQGGAVAGVLAATFILVSPGHRAFATDIMLESMGAALTLLCLLRYLMAVQDDGLNRGKWFGISLSLLFFTKSNYWLIVLVGLAAAEVIRQWPRPLALARVFWHSIRDPAWMRQQARNPWNYALLPLVMASLVVTVSGGGSIQLAGYVVTITDGYNLIGIAYAIFFVRALVWWRRERMSLRVQAAGPIVKGLVHWHLLPVACYLLLPKRLGYFLWFVSPANSDQVASGFSLLRGIPFYVRALATDYHSYVWLLVVMLALVAIVPVLIRSWRPGALGVFMFLVVAALATAQHPMLKNRFAHTWAAVVWVLGSAALVHLIFGWLQSKPRWRMGLAIGLPAALIAVHGSHWLDRGRAQEGGVRPDRPSQLVLPETYLPALEDCDEPTLLCNIYAPFFMSWTYQERTGRRRFATEIRGYSAEHPDAGAVKQWALTTSSDTVLLIEIEPGTPLYSKTPSNVDLAPVRRILSETQSGFRLANEWTPAKGVRITAWRRSGVERRPPG